MRVSSAPHAEILLQRSQDRCLPNLFNFIQNLIIQRYISAHSGVEQVRSQIDWLLGLRCIDWVSESPL
jgi:hypothetical protein